MDSSFRTVWTPQTPSWRLGWDAQVLSLGSCFAIHMADRLRFHGIRVTEDPHGIIYHPLALATNLERIIQGTPYTLQDLVYHQELYASWKHHGKYSSTNAETALSKMNEELREAHKRWAGTDTLILTLGSAWIYTQEGKWVSNCHKHPAAAFERRLLSVAEITAALEKALNLAQQQRPGLKIIVTVSPVRHLKDGLEGNQLSKSILRVAVAELLQKDTQRYYFPAYEILMDDLRDYRWYAEDMTHPSHAAQQYIYEAFCKTCFHPEALANMEALAKVRQGLAHRPLHADTSGFKKHREQMLAQAKAWKERYDWITFEDL